MKYFNGRSEEFEVLVEEMGSGLITKDEVGLYKWVGEMGSTVLTLAPANPTNEMYTLYISVP